MSQMGEKLAQGIVQRGFQCLGLLLGVTQQLYKFRLICSLWFDIRSSLDLVYQNVLLNIIFHQLGFRVCFTMRNSDLRLYFGHLKR